MTTSISDRVTAACSNRSSAMQITISADGKWTIEERIDQVTMGNCFSQVHL